MDTLNGQMERLAVLDTEIQGVEDQIQKASELLGKAMDEPTKAFYRREVEQLRTEKEQLRTEKEQIRTEKEYLRKEEEQLREMQLILLRSYLARAPGGGLGGASGQAAGLGPGSLAAAAGGITHEATGRFIEPRSDAILPLKEVFADGTKHTVGTITIITPDGYAVTAYDNVVWDGYIYIKRLWVLDDNTALTHIASHKKLGVTVFKLKRHQLSGSTAATTSGGSSDRASSSTANLWPYVETAPSTCLEPGATITMCSYPAAVEGAALLTHAQLVSSHGKLLYCTSGSLMGVADYTQLPDSPGGAVMYCGRYLGTHLGGIYPNVHGSKDTVAVSPSRVECNEIVRQDGPLATPAAADPAGPDSLAEYSAAPAVGVAQQVKPTKVDEPQKSLFTPWSAVLGRLQLAGIVERDIELRCVAAAAKRPRRL